MQNNTARYTLLVYTDESKMAEATEEMLSEVAAGHRAVRKMLGVPGPRRRRTARRNVDFRCGFHDEHTLVGTRSYRGSWRS